MTNNNGAQQRKIDRRQFLAAGAANLMILSPQTAFGSAANSAVRLGLIGCGGRGLHVSSSFIEHTGVRVTAIADLYQDRLNEGSEQLGKFGTPPSTKFLGIDAFKELVASDEVDAVQISTPVYFHPEHFEAAVAAGKHVYLEKPVSVDVPGAKRVLRAAAKAKGRQSVTVGLQIRYASPYVELVKRIHDGALGEIVSGLVYYYAGALQRPEWPDVSAVERRVRNWMFDKRLSGDIIVEQNVHVLDVTNWVLKGHPLSVYSKAGRRGRTDQGDCSSHYDCTFVYPNDVHISFASTQFITGSWDVEMRYFGTQANAKANYDSPVRIRGDVEWAFPGLEMSKEVVTDTEKAQTGVLGGGLDDADPNKQKSFIDSITSGNFLNEVDYAAESTLTAIMARQAAETGRVVTWDEVNRSNEVWDPQVNWSRVG